MKLNCQRKNLGFSLVEFVVVLVVMGILATYVTIEWPEKTIQLRAEADQLVNDIRYTQNLATTQSKRYQLVITATGYTLTDAASNSVSFPYTNLSNAVIFHPGITASPVPTTLIFNSLGVPYASPTTPLGSNLVLTLQVGSDVESITVQPETGSVSLN